MIHDVLFPEINEGILFYLAFLCSFAITYFSIPIIVRVSVAKKLFDLPNNRTSHKQATPTLGGIGMFAGVLVASLLFVHSTEVANLQYVIAGSLILFFFGIKDDLMPLSWRMKVLGELLAAFFLIVVADFRFTDLHGFLGIHAIGYVSSLIVTFFVMIGIINAMNLVDGIDGLAGGLSFMATAVFGIWFYLTGHIALTIIAIAVLGMLGAFLGFNVFGTRHKIFMGDTGSLLLGYLMAFFVITFNQYNIVPDSPWFINNAPIVSFTILFIPLFDTMRVMTIRIMNGKSPFSADRNHIHHRILDLGFTHIQTSVILILTNLFFILFVYMMRDLDMHLLVLVVFGLGITKSLVPAYVGRLWLSRTPNIVFTFKNGSKEVAKTIQHRDVMIKN